MLQQGTYQDKFISWGLGNRPNPHLPLAELCIVYIYTVLTGYIHV